AAYTYQMAGESRQQPEYFSAAIMGGKNGTKSIWGWNQIGQKTSRDERFRDAFNEARYNIALCRLEFAATRTDKEEKRKLLEIAKGTIRDTQNFESGLGGATWKPQFEKALKQIQKELGQSEEGLLEFERERNAEAAAGAAKDDKNKDEKK